MKSIWQVQEAKNKFSQVLEQAAIEPQVITKHGRKAGVVMSYATYCQQIRPRHKTVRSLYAKAPKFAADELDFPRDRDKGREIHL